jgi:hypothetical protein
MGGIVGLVHKRMDHPNQARFKEHLNQSNIYRRSKRHSTKDLRPVFDHNANVNRGWFCRRSQELGVRK